MNQISKSRGTTLDTDASSATRLSQHPKPSSQSTGVTYEDLGSDSSRKSSNARPSSPSHEASKQRISSTSGVTIQFSDSDSSPDELDCLPQCSSSRNSSMSPRKSKRIVKRGASIARDTSPSPSPVVVIDHHQANPNYKPIDLNKLKIPKKKKKADDASSSQTPENSQNEETGSSSSRATPPLPRMNARAGSSSEASKARAQPLRERTPNKDRSRPIRSASLREREKDAATRREEQGKDVDKTPRPSRIVPRPVSKGSRNSIGMSQTMSDLLPGSQDKGSMESQQLSRFQSTQEFAGTFSQPIQVTDGDSDGAKTDVPRRKPNVKAQGQSKGKGKGRQGDDLEAARDINQSPFLSPLSSQTDARSPEKGKESARDDPIDQLLNSPSFRGRKANTVGFPALSPLSSPVSRRVSPPLLAPSRAKLKRNVGKARTTVVSSSEDDNEGRQLAPFPMATQVLESLRRVSPAAKRTTLANSIEDECMVYRKKRRRYSEKFSFDADWDSDDEST